MKASASPIQMLSKEHSRQIGRALQDLAEVDALWEEAAHR